MKAKMVCRSLLAWAMLATTPALFGASSALQVKTKSGKVEGKEDGTVRAFLGIPYAAPPVGELRWKPPMPAAKWSGVRELRSSARTACREKFTVT
jgi:carboxylesterase type B